MGTFTFINRRGIELTGYDKATLLQSSFFSILTESSRAKLRTRLKKRINGELLKQPFRFDLITADGTTLPLEATTTPLFENGQLAGIQGIARDISSRLQMEGMLKKKNRILTRAEQIAHLGSWEVNFVNKTTYWSDEFYRICGFRPGQIEPTLDTARELTHPDDRAAEEKALANAIERDGEYSLEKRIVRPDGTVRHIHSIGTITSDEHNQPISITGSFLDITDIRQTEKELRSSRKNYHLLLQNANDMIQSMRHDGTFEFVNRKWLHTLGYSEQESKHLTIWDILHEENFEEYKSIFKNAGAGDQLSDIDTVFRTKSGNTIYVNGNISFHGKSNGTVSAIGIFRNITKRKKIQEERKRLAAAVQHAAELFEITDSSGTILFVNPSFENLTGYTAEEIVGKHARILKSGEQSPEHYRELVTTIHNGHTWQGKLINRKKDGSFYHQQTTISPVKDKHGDITYFVSVGRDITKKEALEHQHRQSQKLEAIGTLASGIAHEINTPSQFIMDNTAFLRDSFDTISDFISRLIDRLENDGDSVPSFIREQYETHDLDFLLSEIPNSFKDTFEGIHRVKKIVGAMKDFAHSEQQEMVLADLNKAVETTITISKNSWKYHAEIQKELDPELPHITCSIDDIKQVILNLIVNAADAVAEKREKMIEEGGSPDMGTITIATETADDTVCLSVSDTGTGITPEVQEKIFEPFFTTKEVGTGSGQGLAITYDIIYEKHGGSIKIDSTPGEGTTFSVFLPRENRKTGDYTG